MMGAIKIDRIVSKLTAPLKRRVNLMVSRVIIEAVKDSLKMQAMKVNGLPDEILEDVERMQEYGFTSVPFKGAEGLMVCVAGRRTHGVIVATDDRTKRPKGLNEGDVALYNGNGVRCLLDEVNDQVKLGNAPTQFAALANLVDERITTLQEGLDGHGHTTTATVGASGTLGVISAPTPLVGALDSVAAEEVLVK